MPAELSRNGSEAYKNADRNVRFRWISPRRSLGPTAVATALINGAALYETGIATRYPIPTAVASSVLYIASAVTDYKTTVRAAEAMQHAEANGIRGQHRERSPLARGETRPEALKKNKKMLMADIAASIVSLFPYVGIPLAISKFRAALENFRTEKVYNRAIEISKSKGS
jgi:hypothetical protein